MAIRAWLKCKAGVCVQSDAVLLREGDQKRSTSRGDIVPEIISISEKAS